MKKTSLIIFLLFLAANGFASDNCKDFEKYRYNPFQFPYPEYYMKAKVIEVKSQKPKMNDDKTKFNFHGLSAVISKKWFDNVVGENKHGHTIAYKIGKKTMFIIISNEEELMGCNVPEVRNAEKDYCSAFSSTQEYFDKIWMLSADDLRKIEYAAKGNSWIVHIKGRWFKDMKAIYKYQGKNFVAYRRDYKDMFAGEKSNLRTTIEIFHQKIAPQYVSIGISYTIENYDELINEILTTLE